MILVASGISNISASKNADGSWELKWTDGKAKIHSTAIDMESDTWGAIYVVAKAVASGLLA